VAERFGPWQTRAITLSALSMGPAAGGSTVSAGITSADRTRDGQAQGNNYPWRDLGTRTAIADQVRTSAVSDHAFNDLGSTFQSFTTTSPDTLGRRVTTKAQVGALSATRSDWTLFNVNSYTYEIFQGRWGMGVGMEWLNNLYDRPDLVDTGNPKALTPPEWEALWDDTFGVESWMNEREVDVLGCSVSSLATLDFTATSPTGPGSVTRHVATSTQTNHWYPPATVYSQPAPGNAPGTVSKGGAFASTDLTDMLNGPHFDFGGGSTDTFASRYDRGGLGHVPGYLMAYVQAPWRVEDANQGLSVVELLQYDPQASAGSDPGFDDAASFPGVSGQNHAGGTAANRWAVVRLQVDWTFTVRWRWTGFITAPPPPLHQRGRLGVMDAPTQVVSGRMSPQSSGVQGGIL
jgi:hypothetical protein